MGTPLYPVPVLSDTGYFHLVKDITDTELYGIRRTETVQIGIRISQFLSSVLPGTVSTTL